jgi:two-component system NtrC family response regulator
VISIPPLRERREDIPLLAEYALTRLGEQQHRSVQGFAPDAMKRLLEYPYPGNVRELENIVEQALTLCDEDLILSEHLPLKAPMVGDPLSENPDLRTIAEVEADHIRRVLNAVGGNKSRAAEILGIGRRTLYEKIERYALN